MLYQLDTQHRDWAAIGMWADGKAWQRFAHGPRYLRPMPRPLAAPRLRPAAAFARGRGAPPARPRAGAVAPFRRRAVPRISGRARAVVAAPEIQRSQVPADAPQIMLLASYPFAGGAPGIRSISDQETGLRSVGACEERSASKAFFRRSTVNSVSTPEVGLPGKPFDTWVLSTCRTSQSRSTSAFPSISVTPKISRWMSAPVPETSSSTVTISNGAARPSTHAKLEGRFRASSRAISKRRWPTPRTREAALVPRRLRSKTSPSYLSRIA